MPSGDRTDPAETLQDAYGADHTAQEQPTLGILGQVLTCRLLGPVEVRFDDKRIDLGFPRQRTLLAMLLVEVNRLVTVDSLIDRVWADRPPARASHALYADMSKLRRTLTHAPGLRLVRQTGGYRIQTDPDSVDLHRFRTLRSQAHACDNDEDSAALLDQALALWRTEAFADLDNPWLTTLRGPLNNEKDAVVLDCNDAYLRLGRHTRLLTDLASLSAAHPLDERLAAQYLLALYRSGRTAAALTHYLYTRSRLAEELGVDPGPALRELHEQVLRNDPTLLITAPPPTPARPPTPQQLPGHAPHFVGRSSELRHLTELLDTNARDTESGLGGTVVISAIGGAGGIGKTWLALHWAHHHLDRFPDGQLFVDLHGFTPANQPMAPQAAVHGFLTGLGVDPSRIPVDLDARVALYRSSIAGKRMLIVLDNAADAAQVTPLLPGSPTCTVLITSRRYLPSLVTGHNAHPLPLGVLTDDEARHLLQVRLGAERVAAEPDAVAALLAWCGGFPLALGIVIGRALAHPNFPLSVLAAEIREHATTLSVLEDGDAAASGPAVLSWSIRALSTEQTRLFGLLGIAPGPDITLPAAACLAGMPATQARAVLRELEHASLIQQHTPGRYRMHDLIRRHATDTAHHDLTEDVQVEALRRVIDFYTHTAHAAHRLQYPHRPCIPLGPPAPGVHPQPLPDAAAALAWFDTEHPALLAAQHTATRHAWHTAVWQLAYTLDTFHRRRGHRHTRLALWRPALDAATHLPDPATSIIAQRALGNAYTELGHHEEGIEHLHQALALADEHHDTEQQTHIHRLLAWAWELRDDGQQASAHATRAWDLQRTHDQPVWEANALSAVGWLTARVGQYDVARTYCQAALARYRDHNHLDGAANTLDYLGYIAHHSGHDHQAIHYYQQALTLFQGQGNTSDAARTLDLLGHTHLALGEYTQARVQWREALDLYRRQEHHNAVARVQQQLDNLNDIAGSHE